MKYLFDRPVDAYVADNLYRKRDPRFKDVERHVPRRPDTPFAKPKKDKTLFANTEFQLADDHTHCICPAGKRINRNTARAVIGDFEAMKCRDAWETCTTCPLRAQCLRYPQHTPFRQLLSCSAAPPTGKPEKCLEKMKRKIDSDQGRYEYGRRLGTVEPVFGNLRHTHRLNRFSLRGKDKVNAQWLLFCLVHNIGKVQHH